MDNTGKYSFWTKFLFGVYGFFCVMLFVYMLFPYYTLKPKFEDALSRAANLDITISTIKPALPLGWTLGGLAISGNDSLDSLTIKPRILPLIKGDFSLSIKMIEGKGYLKGSVGTSFFKAGRDADVYITMKDFDLSVFKNLSKKLDEMSGKISGDIDISYLKNKPEKSDGNINLVINNGQIPLNIPSFPIAAIPFSKLEMDANLDNGLLKIAKAELTGRDISGSMRGDMKLGGSLSSTDINFMINLKLSDAYKAIMGPAGNDNVRITIGGNLGSPRTSLN